MSGQFRSYNTFAKPHYFTCIKLCKQNQLSMTTDFKSPAPYLSQYPQQPPESNRHSNCSINSNNRATSFPSCREGFGTPQLWLLLLLRPTAPSSSPRSRPHYENPPRRHSHSSPGPVIPRSGTEPCIQPSALARIGPQRLPQFMGATGDD